MCKLNQVDLGVLSYLLLTLYSLASCLIEASGKKIRIIIKNNIHFEYAVQG